MNWDKVIEELHKACINEAETASKFMSSDTIWTAHMAAAHICTALAVAFRAGKAAE